jgi:hypothetical protein
MPIPLILSDNVLLEARLTGEGIRKQLPEGFSEIYSMRSATWSGGWVSKNISFCPMQGQGGSDFHSGRIQSSLIHFSKFS